MSSAPQRESSWRLKKHVLVHRRWPISLAHMVCFRVKGRCRDKDLQLLSVVTLKHVRRTDLVFFGGEQKKTNSFSEVYSEPCVFWIALSCFLIFHRWWGILHVSLQVKDIHQLVSTVVCQISELTDWTALQSLNIADSMKIWTNGCCVLHCDHQKAVFLSRRSLSCPWRHRVLRMKQKKEKKRNQLTSLWGFWSADLSQLPVYVWRNSSAVSMWDVKYWLKQCGKKLLKSLPNKLIGEDEVEFPLVIKKPGFPDGKSQKDDPQEW